MPPIAIIVVIIFVFIILDHKNKKAKELRTHRNWLTTPEAHDYMENNPNSGGRRQGISCCHSGSRSIRQPGVVQ